MNDFEAARQKVIPAVLLYAFSGEDVLMIHKKDHWNGLGGKLEKGESTHEAAIREFQEESGLKTTSHDWNWIGQLYFPNFKSHKNEDWWVTVFTIDLPPEQRALITPDAAGAEGVLYWVHRSKVASLPLWEGDSLFLPYVFSRTPFEGTFFYENGKCVRHELRHIPFRSDNR